MDHRAEMPDPLANFRDRRQVQRLADFIYETGMLRKTPRSGYQFLGSGKENVAEHSFRTAVIGFILADMAGADTSRTVLLCLFHDLHEARTGDFNYVNKQYNSSNERLAVEHALHNTGLARTILPLWEEQDRGAGLEAQLAADADQLDLIANLVEERSLGNPYAAKWLDAAVSRLETKQGRELAVALMETDPTDWWFKGPEAAWWEQRHQNNKEAEQVAHAGAWNEDNSEDSTHGDEPVK